MEEVFKGILEALGQFILGFGNGPVGILILGMILATAFCIFGLPKMFKDYLDYRKSVKEMEQKNKELDLALVERISQISRLQDKKKELRS